MLAAMVLVFLLNSTHERISCKVIHNFAGASYSHYSQCIANNFYCRQSACLQRFCVISRRLQAVSDALFSRLVGSFIHNYQGLFTGLFTRLFTFCGCVSCRRTQQLSGCRYAARASLKQATHRQPGLFKIRIKPKMLHGIPIGQTSCQGHQIMGVN